MVRLPAGFCIDSTEVTRAQYAQWLATGPSLPDPTDALCGWNESYQAAPTCTSRYDVCEGEECDSHPQVCVDWCDAYAYCRGVGRRLCGKIGGGSLAYSSFDDARLSQWQSACSSGGLYAYAYGNDYNEASCHSGFSTTITAYTVAVGSLAQCRSPNPPYDALRDMTGNVGEWEDSCEGTSETASCRIRGGSWSQPESEQACEADVANSASRDYRYDPQRNLASVDVGFRCCADVDG